jgi:hypothetical protein
MHANFISNRYVHIKNNKNTQNIKKYSIISTYYIPSKDKAMTRGTANNTSNIAIVKQLAAEQKEA